MLKFDQLIIVDIESTCWEGDIPPGQQNEIIEVGVCLLALEDGTISQRQGILVRPTRSKVSEFCTRLTTLTQEQVDGGTTFEEACDLLKRDYDAPNRAWASWGNYDRKMFQAQCASFYVEYPFSTHHINVKQRFSQLYRIKMRLGMAQALEYLKLPLVGTHHRGEDDVYNIAVIAHEMIKAHGQDAVLQPT